MREGEPARRGGFSGAEGGLRLPDAQQGGEAPLDVAVGRLGVVRHGDRDFLPRLDIHVDERRRDPEVAQTPPQVTVGKELPPVPLEGVSGRADSFRRQVGGLELLDEPVAGFALETSVEPARQDSGPLLERDAGLKMNLASVGAECFPARGEHAGMDLCAESQPPPSLPAVEPDPAEALLLGQLADVDLEDPGGLIEPHVLGTVSAWKSKTEAMCSIIIPTWVASL